MKTLDTAFAQMVKEHKSTIYTVCFMFSKDADEVSDLFQEVLINLWKGYDSFKNLSNVNTWIWKVSFNTCISCERKKKRRAVVPLTMVFLKIKMKIPSRFVCSMTVFID